MLYRLKVRSTPDGSVALQLGYGWRVFFGAVTLMVVGVVLHSAEARGFVPILGLLSFVATVYRESWRFDSDADEVCSRIGVAFLVRSRRYRLSSLRRILVRTRAPYAAAGKGVNTGANESRSRSFSLASLQRGYVQLILEFVEEGEEEEHGDIARALVQTEPLRGRNHVESLARRLSDALHVPLEIPTW